MSNPSFSTAGGLSGAINMADFNFWQERDSDNKTFTKISWLFLSLTLIFALIVKMTQVPELTREQREKVPVQLTKIIERIEFEPKEIPPPKVEEKIIEEPKIEEKVEPPKVDEQPPKLKAKITTKLDKAIEDAKNSGLLAMKDDLAAMRDLVDLPVAAAPLNANTPIEVKAPAIQTQTFQSQTAQLDTSAANQSGASDINLINRDVVVLADKAYNGSGVSAGNAGAGDNQGTADGVVDGRALQRKIENIRLVLDRNKGAFYTIYRRALRKDPSLEGKVTMRIVVESSGRVSGCDIVTSELNDAALERKLIARLKLINFGKDISEQTSIEYSFNFLPY